MSCRNEVGWFGKSKNTEAIGIHTYNDTVFVSAHPFARPFIVSKTNKKNSFVRKIISRNVIKLILQWICICYWWRWWWWWCYCRCMLPLYWRVTYWLEIMSSSRSLMCMALRHENHIVCLAQPFFFVCVRCAPYIHSLTQRYSYSSSLLESSLNRMP